MYMARGIGPVLAGDLICGVRLHLVIKTELIAKQTRIPEPPSNYL